MAEVNQAEKPEVNHAATHARYNAQADTWATTSGFHSQLIPASVLMGGAGFLFGWLKSDSATLGALTGIACFFVGYFGGLSAAKTRLQYNKWCQEHGWTFQPKGSHWAGSPVINVAIPDNADRLHRNVAKWTKMIVEKEAESDDRLAARLRAQQKRAQSGTDTPPPNNDVVQHAEDARKAGIFWASATRSNIMTKQFGERGASLHHAQKGSGDDEEDALFLVVDTGGTCPDLVIHHHHFSDRVKLPGSLQTVKFESDEFNQKWTVKASDPKEAYARVDQAVMEYLLPCTDAYAIECIGGLLIVKSTKDSLQVRARMLLFVEGLSKALPDDLVAPYEFGCSASA
jgi:hypothetical protein